MLCSCRLVCARCSNACGGTQHDDVRNDHPGIVSQSSLLRNLRAVHAVVSRISARYRRPGMDLTPAPQFPHSLEKCLKVSEDGLAAGPLAHSVSIQGMAVLRALVQRTTGGEMHGSQTQTQKNRKTKLAGLVTFLSSSAGGVARWRWTADWKTLWRLRWLTCYHSHSLKKKSKWGCYSGIGCQYPDMNNRL